MTELKRLKPDVVRSGMALGWDQAVAFACIALHIPYEAYIPYPGQERQWPRDAQQEYDHLLQCAAVVSYTFEEPPMTKQQAIAALMTRNGRLLEAPKPDHLLALWNKRPSSGTWNTVSRASALGIPITNCWLKFKRICADPASFKAVEQ